MRTKQAALFVMVSLFFLLMGLVVGAISFYLATSTAGQLGANECCGYVDYVLQKEADGELGRIPINQFEIECGLRSGIMISHEYQGNSFIEFRSFCGSLSVGVSVIYVATNVELDDRDKQIHLFPVCVDLVRDSNIGESVYGLHSTRRSVFDREKYELYLASLERQ